MKAWLINLRRFWPDSAKGGKLRIAIALALVVAASGMFWASRDYGVIAPEWDGQVRGIAYNPSHVFDQEDNKSIPYEQIDHDMGATGADHRPCPHLYGRAWHGQGAGDCGALRVDCLVRYLDQRRSRLE